MRELKARAEQLGLTSKRYTQQSGRVVGGYPLARGQLYHILKNPLYAGKIRHKDKIHEGQHQAIVDQETWDKVQAFLTENWGIRQTTRNTPSHGWLSRILVDSSQEPMVATHAKKQGRIYRYYISSSLTHKKPDPAQGWRLPAKEIEGLVLKAVQTFLNDPIKVLNVLGITKITAALMAQIKQATARLMRDISSAALADLATLVRPLIHQVQVSLYEVTIRLDVEALANVLGIAITEKTMDGRDSHHEGSSAQLANSVNHHNHGDTMSGATGLSHEHINSAWSRLHRVHTIILPVQLKRRGAEMRIVIPGQEQNSKRDDKLVTLIAQAHRWFEGLKSGVTITDIARSNNIHLADVSRTLPLAFLSPDIITAILKGTHPIDLTAEKLKRLCPLPYLWPEQKHPLGFE